MRAFFVDLERHTDPIREYGLLVDAASVSDAVRLAEAFRDGILVGNSGMPLTIVGVRTRPTRGKQYLPPTEFRL